VAGVKEAERAELHKTIWRIANELRGSVDGWDFKSYVLGMIIAEEGLKPVETRAFVDGAFRDGAIAGTGTAITKILPPVSRFSGGNSHAAKKQAVLERLMGFFDRFFALT
jgi:type I restriction enzyme R subunit